MNLSVKATFMREAPNGEGTISADHLVGEFDDEAAARFAAERAGRQGFWATFSYFVPPSSIVCVQLVPVYKQEGASQ